MDSGEVPPGAAAPIVSDQVAVAPPYIIQNPAVMPYGAAPHLDPNHPFIAAPDRFVDYDHPSVVATATSISASGYRPTTPTGHNNITNSFAQPAAANPIPSAKLIPSAPNLRKRDRTLRRSLPEWVMLDGFLRRSGDDSSLANFAYGFASTSDLLGVGFTAALPPGTSRLFFSWTKTKKKKRRSGSLHVARRDSPTWSPDAAKVVAVHRNSILLRFLLPNEEFFIYKPRSAALQSLPACGHTVNGGEGNTIGILCRGGEVVAAHLILTKRDCPVTAELCFIMLSQEGSQEGSWHKISMPIQHGPGMDRELWWWQTDVVVAFGDYIVWVDYLRGLILCDVFSSKPQLRYVSLPVRAYNGQTGPMGIRGALFAHRSICVANSHTVLKFVDIASSELWFSHGCDNITCWTLCGASLTWTLDGAVGVHTFADLCAALDFQHVRPEFPLVDVKYPQIVYLVLKEESPEETKAVLVGVDMISKAIGRPTAYGMRGSLFGGEDDRDTICSNLYHNEPFLALEMDDMEPNNEREIKCVEEQKRLFAGGYKDWDDGYDTTKLLNLPVV